MQLARKVTRLLILITLFLAVVAAAFFLADFVSTNNIAQNIINQFGYFGVFVLAVISGINILIPVPAATFTPVFQAAGLWMPIIILTLALGTLVADLIGYILGKWSKSYVEEHYPHSYRRIAYLYEHHYTLLLPLVFVYAAVVPFPNEAILIPLAIMGFKFRQLVIPLILGNIVNQAALAYGASNIFMLLF